MTPALPATLVAALERLRTSSPAMVRDTVYQCLLDAGVDVAYLARAEHEAMASDWRAAVEAKAATLQLIRSRIDAGTIAPGNLAGAIKRAGQLDARVKAERQELNRRLRQLAARPLPPPPSAPTPERLRHHGEAPVITDRDEHDAPLATPRYRLVWAIDRMQGLLTDGEYMAAARTRDVYQQHQPRSRVADLNGAGGGVPGSRMPVTVRQVRAGAEWTWVGRRLPVAVRGIVLGFVCGEPPQGRDEPWTAVEFGRVYGGVKDEKTARGVTYGAVKTACVLLEMAWAEHDAGRVNERHEARNRAARERV